MGGTRGRRAPRGTLLRFSNPWTNAAGAARLTIRRATQTIQLLNFQQLKGWNTISTVNFSVAEVAALLAQEKRRDALTDMANLDEIPFERAESSGLYTHAIALAVRHGHHLFDTL